MACCCSDFWEAGMAVHSLASGHFPIKRRKDCVTCISSPSFWHSTFWEEGLEDHHMEILKNMTLRHFFFFFFLTLFFLLHAW